MTTHVINRQIIDLKVQSQKNAYSIQQRVREIYFSEVVPMFDRIMNELTDGDHVLVLDRLEIDLGEMTVDQLDRQLTSRLRERISAQLREKVTEALAAPGGIGEPGKVFKHTSTESKLRLLGVFLETGNIPWWTGDEHAPPDIDAIVDELLEKQPVSLLGLLAGKTTDSRVALRMTFQFSEKTRRRILSHFTSEVIAAANKLVNEIIRVHSIRKEFSTLAAQADAITFLAILVLHREKKFSYSTENDDALPFSVLRAMETVFTSPLLRIQRILYREAILQCIVLPTEPAFYPVLLQYFKEWESAHISEAEKITGDAMLSIAALTSAGARSASAPMDAAIQRFLRLLSENDRRIIPGKRKKRSSDKSITPHAPTKKTEAETDAELTALVESMLFPHPPEVNEQVSSEANETGDERNNRPSLAITRCAGLMLLAPFLPAFFEEIKLLNEGIFKDEAAQFKAVHLLHFLATNKTKAPEYQLALQKVLCGLETTEVVPKNIKLTSGEKKSALGFLDDIAEQWTALQGASGESLRETFMKRNGILEQREGALLLRVEQSPMDVLLDTLPWNISIIRLPWMKQLLHVEW